MVQHETSNAILDNENMEVSNENMVSVSLPSPEKPKIGEKRKYKDPRSSIVDMEHEEHILRMKILSEQLYTATLQRKQEELKLKMLQKEFQDESSNA